MKMNCRLPVAGCRLLKNNGNGFSFSIGNRKWAIGNAFTLLELLVVISILGLMAALAVPALKNFGKSNTAISATQQMLRDVARARQLAIANRATVYMVFVPTNFWLPPTTGSSTWTNSLSATNFTVAATLLDKQLSGYNFVAYGALGDQPGQHKWHYLAPWQNLPDGAFIATLKFSVPGTVISSSANPLFQSWTNDYPHSDNTMYAFATNAIPFPTQDATNYLCLPFIAFNYLGQLTFDGQNLSSRDEYIPLARGSVFAARDGTTKALQFNSPDVSEIPPGNSTNISYNIIHIDALTGRATVEFHKVQ